MGFLDTHEITARVSPEQAERLQRVAAIARKPDEAIIRRCLDLGLPIIETQLKAPAATPRPFKP